MENFQAEWILRLVLALLSGILIGFERHSRAKAAGLRTHAIVALAACLLMIVSKHGFEGTDKFDAARVAAQVVSGVGFLGAGVIFVRNDNVMGLTTAAGIFMTAALGLCYGAGLYVTGLITLCLLIIMEIILPKTNEYSRINVILSITADQEADPDQINDVIHSKGFHNHTFTVSAREDGYFITAHVYSIRKNNPFELIEALRNTEHITSAEMK